MRGTKQLVMVLAAVAAAVLLAAGLAVAAELTGTDGPDEIQGTAGVDEIHGKAGNDTLEGMAGNDRVVGDGDDDMLYGGDAAGTVETGNDVLEGQSGNDTLWGGSGRDELRGGPNNDNITAGTLDEAAEDKIYGGDGTDTIYSANLPASKDIVDCGGGTDEVTADSQDQVASNCESVERIQEEEPDLADGTYQLVPDPSSECDLGQGTLTIGNDPETGEHGAEVEFDKTEVPKEAGILACEIEIDYQRISSAQGEVSAQTSDTVSYEGDKPPQEVINADLEEPSGAEALPSEEPLPPPSSEEVGAQYAWTANKFTQIMTTRDPAFIRLNQTRYTLGWWHNGSRVGFRYTDGHCYANPDTGLSSWYTSQCSKNRAYFGSSGYLDYVGSLGRGGYYNYDFAFSNPRIPTIAIHRNLVEGYDNGSAYRLPIFRFSGEYYWLLLGYSYGYYGNYIGPG